VQLRTALYKVPSALSSTNSVIEIITQPLCNAVEEKKNSNPEEKEESRKRCHRRKCKDAVDGARMNAGQNPFSEPDGLESSDGGS